MQIPFVVQKNLRVFFSYPLVVSVLPPSDDALLDDRRKLLRPVPPPLSLLFDGDRPLLLLLLFDDPRLSLRMKCIGPNRFFTDFLGEMAGDAS